MIVMERTLSSEIFLESNGVDSVIPPLPHFKAQYLRISMREEREVRLTLTLIMTWEIMLCKEGLF
jgi:hypothetical protein